MKKIEMIKMMKEELGLKATIAILLAAGLIGIATIGFYVALFNIIF